MAWLPVMQVKWSLIVSSAFLPLAPFRSPLPCRWRVRPPHPQSHRSTSVAAGLFRCGELGGFRPLIFRQTWQYWYRPSKTGQSASPASPMLNLLSCCMYSSTLFGLTVLRKLM